MDVNDSLEPLQTQESATPEPAKAQQPNWFLSWMDSLKTVTTIRRAGNSL
jgi:hypothetical protein